MNRGYENIDWSKTTFEGAERENLRSWQQLSFDQKLRANESMNEIFEEIIRRKIANGEPYIDPETGKLVRESCAPRKDGATDKSL